MRLAVWVFVWLWRCPHGARSACVCLFFVFGRAEPVWLAIRLRWWSATWFPLGLCFRILPIAACVCEAVRLEYEKRVVEEVVPCEVVRPSVTLFTRCSVIANGR